MIIFKADIKTLDFAGIVSLILAVEMYTYARSRLNLNPTLYAECSGMANKLLYGG